MMSRKKTLRRKASLSLFFIPALALISIFMIFPVFQTFYISFFSPEGEFVGFDNYFTTLSRREILNLERFPFEGPPFGALVHNMIWILIHLPSSLFLGLSLAVLLRRMKGGSVVKSIIFLGMVTPMIVGGMMLRFIYDAHAGILNAFLGGVGLGWMVRTWTAYPDTALYSTILGGVWMWTGYSMIVYSAGLENISEDLYEAADVDGATPLQKFFYITIPMLKPATISVVTMTILWELKIFDIVYSITLGGPGGASMVLALQMYFDAFRRIPPNFGGAAAIATLLTLLTLGVSVYMIRYMMKK